MRAGFYQYDVVHRDRRANLDKVAAAVSAASFDLLVLPEFFTSGYFFRSREEVAAFAEPVPAGETTAALVDLARGKQAYVAGSLVERENERFHITVALAGPHGYVGRYRKRHLAGAEQACFDRGGDLPVFDLGGVRVGVLICFDSWFPEGARALMRQGAQIICCPANFGGPWTPEVSRVRALENGLFYISANRTGPEFRGESQVIGTDGRPLVQAGAGEQLEIVQLDPAAAQAPANLVCADWRAELALYPVPRE